MCKFWCFLICKRWLSYNFCLIIAISGGNNATGAIAGGVAVGAVLLFAAPAIAFAWWRQRKPHEHFFDVPGLCSLLKNRLNCPFGCVMCFTLYIFHQPKRIQKSTWDSSKVFCYENCKLQQSFSNKNILRKGGGGFGKVYKGCLPDGSLVAVKRIKEEGSCSFKQKWK
ncbi:hypothetical protein ACSBR2_015416 [Camellia fascicularis]